VTPERTVQNRVRTGLRGWAFSIAFFNLTAVLVPIGAALVILTYTDGKFWLACVGALAVASVTAMLWYAWLRRRMIVPLQRISNEAQALVDDPTTAGLFSETDGSLVQDLAAVLLRLQERLQRLAECDATEIQNNEQIGKIKALFSEAAGGNLALRAEVLPGRFQELALSANHLLESLTQRWLLLNRLAERVRLAGVRLHSLAAELRGLSEREPLAPILDPLPEMLRVSIERLVVSADTLGRVLEPILATKLASGKRERFNRALSSASTSLTFLAQRATDLARSGKRIADAHKQAETLATNLLLLGDDQPQPHVRRSIDRATALERDLAECETHLTHGIEYLLGSREQLATSVQELIALYGDVAERLQTWETACDQLLSIREELRHQVDLIRPIGGSVSSYLQRLQSELTSVHKDSSERRQRLQDLCAQTEQVAQLSNELLVLLERADLSLVSQPPPAPQKDNAPVSPAIRATHELIQRAQEAGIISGDALHGAQPTFSDGYDIEIGEPEDAHLPNGNPGPEARR
jgi:methyl-accepting chemotaxis protein